MTDSRKPVTHRKTPQRRTPARAAKATDVTMPPPAQTRYALGKTAATDDVQFKLADLVDLDSVLPKIPAVLGHEGLLPTNIGMLGNDQYGDCAWAGAAHETMLWNLEAGRVVAFTEAAVLRDYAEVTGFNPSKPGSDKGTNIGIAAWYRRVLGVHDGHGGRHKIAAYLALKPGDLDELAAAAYLFNAVGIGLQLPETAQDQFQTGQPWTVVKGSEIEGGHYVPLVGRRSDGNYVVLTWGRAQVVTPDFLTTYCDEALAYVSHEQLVRGRSPEGFNADELRSLLRSVRTSA